MSLDLEGIRQLLPYLQVVLVALLAWLARDVVVRQDRERKEQARIALQDRLSQAYGPMYFVVGEILMLRLSGRSVSEGTRSDLREILRNHGHQLRQEHYRFCVDLMMGKHPSAVELVWHRLSVHRELEKLRFLVHGQPSEMESALSPGALNALNRLAGQLLSYVLALGVWVLLLGGITLLVLGGLAHAPKALGLVVLGITLLRALQEIIRIHAFRSHFAPTILRNLHRGSRGKDVELLQLMLSGAGCKLGLNGIDGVFGKDTEEAIRSFQQSHGVKPTGRLDAKTRMRLYDAATKDEP